jgi:hypothetical protein
MVQSLRIEYPGFVYHVTSRGVRREPIAKDDIDRIAFLSIAGQALERFDERKLGSGLALILLCSFFGLTNHWQYI